MTPPTPEPSRPSPPPAATEAAAPSEPNLVGPAWRDPLAWVELFALSNIAFLAVDILVAHAVNEFAHPAEWVPVQFSVVGSIVLGLAMLGGGLRPASTAGLEVPRRRRMARSAGMLVGWGAIAVGVAGLLLHLRSQFFELRTLESLVYSAPVVAPLAYTGLGLLLLLNRMIPSRHPDWARWVLVLALGGCLGNFLLCLLDHAQNGFWHPTEWIGVVAGALGSSTLLGVVVFPGERAARRLAWAVLALEMAVGLLGFWLHGQANLHAGTGSLRDRFVFGAPIFAPLLFNNMALLAGLGLWGLARAEPVGAARRDAEGLAAAPA